MQVNECQLRRHLLQTGVACEESGCLFWNHLGFEGASEQPQCAIEYFDLLDGRGPEMAEWLLRVKGRNDLADVIRAASRSDAGDDEG
jgi:hypothetical protein